MYRILLVQLPHGSTALVITCKDSLSYTPIVNPYCCMLEILPLGLKFAGRKGNPDSSHSDSSHSDSSHSDSSHSEC